VSAIADVSVGRARPVKGHTKSATPRSETTARTGDKTLAPVDDVLAARP
jgi:hypothetical protein